MYEDEVVLLQEQLLQQGAGRGLPGLKYQLAELQVRGSSQRLKRSAVAARLWCLKGARSSDQQAAW